MSIVGELGANPNHRFPSLEYADLVFKFVFVDEAVFLDVVNGVNGHPRGFDYLEQSTYDLWHRRIL